MKKSNKIVLSRYMVIAYFLAKVFVDVNAKNIHCYCLYCLNG